MFEVVSINGYSRDPSNSLYRRRPYWDWGFEQHVAFQIYEDSNSVLEQEQLERLRDEIAVKAGKDRKLRGARVLGSNMVSKTWWNHRWARKPRPKVRRWRSCPANCRAARHWSKGGNGKPGMVDLMVHSGIALSRGSMIEIIVIRYENPYQISTIRWKGKEVDQPIQVDKKVFWLVKWDTKGSDRHSVA